MSAIESGSKNRRIEFDGTLRKSKILLKISGVFITKTDQFTVKNSLFYVFNLLWLYMDVFGEIFWFINGVKEGKSFEELTFIAPLFTICVLSTVKSVSLFVNLNLVCKIIEKLKSFYIFADDEAIDLSYQEKLNDVNNKDNDLSIDDFKANIYDRFGKFSMNLDKVKELKETNGTINSEINNVFNKGVKNFNLLNSCFIFASYSTAPSFILLPLVLMGFDYYKNEEVVMRLPFFVDYLLFDPFQNELWPFIYFHQVWSTIIVSASVLGADTLFFAFCSHLQMQFKTLGLKFKNLVPKNVRPEQMDKVRRKLFLLIRRHQDLIELVENVESIYNKSVLFNFITSSFLMCLSAFNITTVSNLGTVFAFLTFLIMSLSQIFILCYCGDMVMISSKDIGNYVYSCKWYLMDNKLKKCLLIVLHRAKKPCKLTAAHFADLNLTAFTTVLSRSWSYFALLKTVYN